MQGQRSSHRNGAECWQQASVLAAHIAALREPYRQNAIQWLEACTARPIKDVDVDLADFFDGLHPETRRAYVDNLKALLSNAIEHFGMVG